MRNRCCSNKRVGHTRVPRRGDRCPVGIVALPGREVKLGGWKNGQSAVVWRIGENQPGGVVFPQGGGHCR